MGVPKALITDNDGPWLTRAVQTLTDAGCRPVIVVLGAEADAALELLAPRPPGVTAVIADDWAEGMSASLRAGLAAMESTEATSAVVTLVDLPGLPRAAVARLALDAGSTTLRQAVYGGRPGHPVVIGRDHWTAVAVSADGDRGARAYLVDHRVDEIECDDLWSGRDIDARDIDARDIDADDTQDIATFEG